MALALDLLRKLLAKLFFLRLLPALFRGETRGPLLERSEPGLAELPAGSRLADALKDQVQVPKLQPIMPRRCPQPQTPALLLEARVSPRLEGRQPAAMDRAA